MVTYLVTHIRMQV